MIRAALVVTVHCDHADVSGTRCPRFDEFGDRPDADTAGPAVVRARAAEEFRRRGWVTFPGGTTYCSDHAPSPGKETRP